jgi:hypothetical protein
MKYLKLKLILLGILILASFIVIGDFRISLITYPVLLVCIPFLIYKYLLICKIPGLEILFSIILICCLLYLTLSTLRFFMCGYGDRKDEYVNRKNKNIKIVGRDFSCFGTTGDLVLYKNYSLTDNIGFEIYYKTFPDYKNVKIDSAVWQRIDK